MRALPLASAMLCLAPVVAHAQARASLGLGVNTVRSSGASTTSPALSPSLGFSSNYFYTDLSGVAASMPAGEWSGSGRGTLWLSTPAFLSGLHVAAEGAVAGTTHTGGPWTAAAHGLGELYWAGSRGGAGVAAGPSTGWIESQPSVTAFHARARAWWRVGGLDWSALVEPTRFYGAWFTDLTAGVTLTRGRLAVSAWGLARTSSTYGSRTAVSASGQYFVFPFLAIELAGGSYLPDPYQGLPQARFITAGLRIHSSRRASPPAPPKASPLVPAWAGDSVLLQFHMPGAHSVAIAGEWNDWAPASLRSAGNALWSGAFVIPEGVHHFVLVVDGAEWVVPGGVATVPDGMGGMTALLLVARPAT